MVRWFDSLHVCLAMTPFAVYLLVIGWLNLRRRTTVISGFHDTLWLGVAVFGLVVVGPIELFFPETAAFKLGVWVWPLLIGLYWLLIVLLALSQRPRLVFYNARLSDVMPLVQQAASEVDANSRSVGNCLVLPDSQMQLHVSTSPLFRNIQVESLGEEHNLAAWQTMRGRLITAGSELASGPSLAGYAFVGVAAFCLAMLGLLSFFDQREMARAMVELLRRD